MKRYQQPIDYSKYTCEEFLQDDFFISSMKYSDEETAIFWHDFELSKPSNLESFIEAKKIILAFSTSHVPLSGIEKQNLWDRIDATNHKGVKLQRYRFSKAGLFAAASVALLLVGFFFIKSYFKVENIISFAAQAKIDLPLADESLLVLSKNNIVALKHKESQISYDSNEIKVDQKNISKEEISTYNQLLIPFGKRSFLKLSDGTKIWVNAGTRLIYPSEFEKEKREIYVDGEIYLEVAKDPDRPFYVRTKDMSVRVLGTKFNVNAYESESSHNVVLVEGKVQVSTKQKQEAVLAPNQMYTLVGQEQEIRQVNAPKFVSWIHGIYNFEGVGLENVIRRLSAYYGVDVDCDPSLAQVKCSGKIDLKESFETVIYNLTFVAPISYTYDTLHSTYRITKK